MRVIAVSLAALALTGCIGGEDNAAPPPVPPGTVITTGGTFSARLLDSKVVGKDHTHLYVLQSEDPAAYLKHDMAGFLEQIRFGRASKYNGNPDPVVVRLLDGEGRKVWWAGHRGNEGWVGAATPELDACSPIWHTQPASLDNSPPPVCPAG